MNSIPLFIQAENSRKFTYSLLLKLIEIGDKARRIYGQSSLQKRAEFNYFSALVTSVLIFFMQCFRRRLGDIYLTVTVALSFAIGTAPVYAQEVITNTASASGDNLSSTVNSNDTTLFAEQAKLELIKTADRAAAEPGDTVVYRLALRNVGVGAATNISITDRLPLGINYIPRSLQSSITVGTTTTAVPISPATTSGRTITFTFPRLEAQQTLNIIYAAEVTPDAVRGTGRNTAQEPRSNVATFLLRVRAGILSECGTIIGRVFVDKNFDGEQQPGEPGMPNAVVYMDDGNRITTDANGLFHVKNVIAGNRTGTLDLTSLPGYELAPNHYFIERNSQSRLVRLEPGGLVRMNFAVTPASGEEEQP